MTSEERRNSTLRGIRFLRYAISVNADIKRGLAFYTYLQIATGMVVGMTIGAAVALLA